MLDLEWVEVVGGGLAEDAQDQPPEEDNDEDKWRCSRTSVHT